MSEETWLKTQRELLEKLRAAGDLPTEEEVEGAYCDAAAFAYEFGSGVAEAAGRRAIMLLIAPYIVKKNERIAEIEQQCAAMRRATSVSVLEGGLLVLARDAAKYANKKLGLSDNVSDIGLAQQALRRAAEDPAANGEWAAACCEYAETQVGFLRALHALIPPA